MMAKRSNILKRSKRVEAEVASYFWPDHDEDETGSVRDWKELWDVSGPCLDDEVTVVCEVKSWKWPRGPRALQTLLDNAWGQLFIACMTVWPQPDDSLPEPWEVVVYKPTGSRIADAICYFGFHGEMVAMPAHQFKRVFIEGESQEEEKALVAH